MSFLLRSCGVWTGRSVTLFSCERAIRNSMKAGLWGRYRHQLAQLSILLGQLLLGQLSFHEECAFLADQLWGAS